MRRQTTVALGNTAGTVTMCQTEIAAAKTNSPSRGRARFRCTATRYPSRPPRRRLLLRRREKSALTQSHLLILSLGLTLLATRFPRRSLRERYGNVAWPHLRVRSERRRESVLRVPRKISWFQPFRSSVARVDFSRSSPPCSSSRLLSHTHARRYTDANTLQ